MRALLAAVLMATVVACGPRQVEVRSNPAPSAGQAEVSLHFTNNLSTPVNVYVTPGGGSAAPTFLRQVSGNSAEHIPIPGIPAGSTVTLSATKVDNSYTYTKSNVVLTGMYSWQVP
jgi:hypothetical protein